MFIKLMKSIYIQKMVDPTARWHGSRSSLHPNLLYKCHKNAESYKNANRRQF